MGGTLAVSSEVGVGSTFTLALPVERCTSCDHHDPMRAQVPQAA